MRNIPEQESSNLERIKKDIEEFYKTINDKNKNKHISQEVKDMAIRYANDAEYFLGIKDYFTAWGCINYAFGLIDAELKLIKKIEK
ncbi:MAG: DUF357 domain-containing protein [Candidatus Micrarchaeota archaeon]|nr:DUF357 domain-containing protein [Candidatus Micrarchaeota archaeon]